MLVVTTPFPCLSVVLVVFIPVTHRQFDNPAREDGVCWWPR
jgi:hypothetical protein